MVRYTDFSCRSADALCCHRNSQRWRWRSFFATLYLQWTGSAGQAAPDEGGSKFAFRPGRAGVHVFTFSDRMNTMLCHLGRTVEAAGGWLHVLGLRDGAESKLPWGDIDGSMGSQTKEGEPWHFEDKAVMLKKHVYLARALRLLPGNTTVVFVDAWDVLFQRPLEELEASYRRLAQPVAAMNDGIWPVVFGGERNCWPFPHDGRLPVHGGHPREQPWVHEIRRDASLSSGHRPGWHYPVGDRSPWSIKGDQFCSAWLSERGGPGSSRAWRNKVAHEPILARMPFLCAGTFMGTAGSLRRIMKRMFALYTRTKEYHDQALMALLLLQNRTLGLVDTEGKLFLGLHGYDEEADLARPLCKPGYFEPYEGGPGSDGNLDPMPGGLPRRATALRTLTGLLPPASTSQSAEEAPALLHFNGNGKRHLNPCIRFFRQEGLLGGKDEESGECTFYDADRRSWIRYASIAR
eukprot:gnl/TRDRNA2_/TRDRNA2_177207_c4_seq1.p1 gnl/TRDRNA2_/TRDRNA2_177207_c4~~gnl/TRDRNA2_/TRDRNA2_177207_c4_seq1.p1  ORF type:complete len:463 (+),score=52.80 gnl/TRDRNA2_/TRDRNA2_177207_c4_seq1:91-1479(+)